MDKDIELICGPLGDKFVELVCGPLGNSSKPPSSCFEGTG